MELLNLGQVRQRYWRFCNQTVQYANRTQQQSDDADFLINQVCERVITSGAWHNTLRRITLPINDEFITMPREFGVILGIKLQTDSGCCWWSQVYSKFHEFAQSCTCCSGGTYPISETAQTFITPSENFTLRVVSTGSGTLQVIGGWDANGNQIYTTETITFNNNTVDGTTTYSSLPYTGGIQKSVTTAPVYLYSVISGTAELIAVYAPNEQIPAYKKYKVPNWNSQFTTAIVMGKLAYVEAIEDTDIVIPSHWGALKQGLLALQAEDTIERDNAKANWQVVYDILNGDLIEAEGANELPIFHVASQTGCENIYQIV